MKLLAIDTSNQAMSIAVMENETLIGELTTNLKRNHSERLMPAIDALMKELSLEIQEIDRVAVAKGPGSYTGLRIGVTTAKTLAWTLNIELTGISSLKVLAANVNPTDQYIVPVMDARRGNIYTGLYQYQKGVLVEAEPNTHISADKWAEYLSRKEGQFILVGEDYSKHLETFEKQLMGRVSIASPQQQVPKASVLGILSLASEVEEVHTFTPDYLKLAEAEENWRAAHPDLVEDNYVEKI
ncbi:tRNA (adenosine(37)-N6)-threonylcarbamoyltransferase complex dimerization subunit type 1 TsaB [Desemzia sp. FAM 23991]|uniref:tRNA (adenosine(37)-N6)-threonylcarbamoyltransferase complex dimerization subunit type 1 TsaB n=1 Tax=unclassified Desemzia TaxID=2685243 RepID=UPI00388406B7